MKNRFTGDLANLVSPTSFGWLLCFSCHVFSRLEWSTVVSTRTAFQGGIDGHRQLLIAESFIQSLLTQGKDPCLLITLPSLPLDVDTTSCLSSWMIIFNQEQQLILVIFCGAGCA